MAIPMIASALKKTANPSTVNIAATGAVFVGLAGVLSVRDRHDLHVRQQACVRDRPAPLYSINPSLALPWITESGPHFVYGYNYAADRAHGRIFERGGIGGLVGEGYFGALALPKDAQSVDGGPLTRYELADPDCGGLAIYVRKP